LHSKENFRRQLHLQLDAFEPDEQIDFDNVLQIHPMIVVIAPVGASCQCLNLSTCIGGTRSKVEGGDRHDLEPEGMHEDTRHKIYTGSGSQSSYPTSCLE
jgi:hypothetical protein